MSSNFYLDTELEILSIKDPDSALLLLRDEIQKLCHKFSHSGQSGGTAPYTAVAIVKEIKETCSLKVLNEIYKDSDSLTYEFTYEIINICQKIKDLSLEGDQKILDSIKNLLLHEPVYPILGIEQEWADVSEYLEDNKKWFQNKRCSALFKDGINGKAYYIDAIVNKDKKGMYWSGFFWLSKDDFESGDRNKMVGKKAYVKSFPFTPKTFYLDVIDVKISKNHFETFIKDPKQLEQVWDYYDPN